jgi:hypothetical protein
MAFSKRFSIYLTVVAFSFLAGMLWVQFRGDFKEDSKVLVSPFAQGSRLTPCCGPLWSHRQRTTVTFGAALNALLKMDGKLQKGIWSDRIVEIRIEQRPSEVIVFWKRAGADLANFAVLASLGDALVFEELLSSGYIHPTLFGPGVEAVLPEITKAQRNKFFNSI